MTNYLAIDIQKKFLGLPKSSTFERSETYSYDALKLEVIFEAYFWKEQRRVGCSLLLTDKEGRSVRQDLYVGEWAETSRFFKSNEFVSSFSLRLKSLEKLLNDS